MVIVIDPQCRGGAAEGAKKSKNVKVSGEMMVGIANLIDQRHSEGEGVVANNIDAYLYNSYGLRIHRTHANQLVKKLGLTWAPIKCVESTFASHRNKYIRDFLLKMDDIIWL